MWFKVINFTHSAAGTSLHVVCWSISLFSIMHKPLEETGRPDVAHDIKPAQIRGKYFQLSSNYKEGELKVYQPHKNIHKSSGVNYVILLQDRWELVLVSDWKFMHGNMFNKIIQVQRSTCFRAFHHISWSTKQDKIKLRSQLRFGFYFSFLYLLQK